MSDPHAVPAAVDTADHAHEGHISDSTFVKVFGALLVFTLVSFLTNQLVGSKSAILNFMIIGAVAVCKAALVIAFFMHFKFDWRKFAVFMIPVCILAPLVVIVLWPDIVFAWRLAGPPE